MKILLAGDTHGNILQFQYLHEIMKDQGITRGIVVGDFGLWPGAGGARFLDQLEKLCIRDGIHWDWLDGNHEDHARIQQWMKRPDAYLRAHKVKDHVYYLPRGFRFEVDGVKFGVLGGAWSIDQGHRTPYVSWWPEEEITESDFRRLVGDGEPLDILLTHDMPEDGKVFQTIQFRMAPGGSMNRRYVAAAVEVLRPRILVHGHMHHRYDAVMENGTRVIGLDCDGTAEKSWIVWDSSTYERELAS